MKRVAWLRKNHKWLALICGLQLFIWSVSGLYMVSVDLDIIHGNHLVNEPKQEPIEQKPLANPSDEVVRKNKPIKSIQLEQHFGRQFYRLEFENGKIIIDALSGNEATPLTRQDIEAITSRIYAGKAPIESILLLPEYPSELRPIKEPIWKVQFFDIANSTLYFHYQTGQLVSKRTNLWRIFDFFWFLHIIEYLELDGYHGIVFRVLTILSLIMAGFGAFLLLYRLKPEASI